MLADFHVRCVPRRLWSAVYCIVFGCRNHSIVLWVVALHARDKRNPHARCQERIFAIGFLPTTPTGIAKDIDVGRPEVQAFENIAMPIPQRLDMLDSPFGADHNRHSMDRIGVERRSQTDRLRKLCCPVRRDAVQRLTPPVISGHFKTWDSARLID